MLFALYFYLTLFVKETQLVVVKFLLQMVQLLIAKVFWLLVPILLWQLYFFRYRLILILYRLKRYVLFAEFHVLFQFFEVCALFRLVLRTHVNFLLIILFDQNLIGLLPLTLFSIAFAKSLWRFINRLVNLQNALVNVYRRLNILSQNLISFIKIL